MVRCVTTEKLFYDAYSYTFGHTDRKSALEVLPHRQKKKFSSSFTTFLTMKRKLEQNFLMRFFHIPRCLKIIVNVSFKIASEASYVYILSGQK